MMPCRRETQPRCGAVVGFICALLIAIWSTPTVAAAPRIASINLCTDQLLLMLADPAQILGLSPFARDPTQSFAAAAAISFPLLSGDAEDVLELKPDLVVASRFSKSATREFLKAQSVAVAEFDPALTIDDIKAQIVRMAELIGHPERATEPNARIDAAVARARAAVARKPMRVLELSRRGWVSGRESLTSSLLTTMGLSNAAGDFSFQYGGFASLEEILVANPDLLLLTQGVDLAEDQGRAFLLHPALERFYPQKRRMVLPERLTVCGGPMIVDALDRLVTEYDRVNR